MGLASEHGAYFLPPLALALGTLAGTGKLFESLFVTWAYVLT
jgi:hypothetical protein